jgi:hypothetical protein
MNPPPVRVSGAPAVAGPPKLPAGAPALPATSLPAPGVSRPVVKVALSWQDWLMRLVLALVVAASATAVYWSYQRLARLQQRSRRLEDTVSRLNTDIALLEGKYSQSDIDRLLARSKEAEALLFAGQDALLEWFTDLKLQLVPLSLNAVADFGQALTNRAGSHALAVVPATVAVEVGPAPQIESRRSPYERSLLLMQLLAQQPKRVDVVGLTAVGGSNSLQEARVVLDLWAGDEIKENQP